MSPLELTEEQRKIVDPSVLKEADRLAEEISALPDGTYDETRRRVRGFRVRVNRAIGLYAFTGNGGLDLHLAFNKLLDEKENVAAMRGMETTCMESLTE